MNRILFAKVLEIELLSWAEIKIEDETVKYKYADGFYNKDGEISLYKLGNSYKKWATSKGYALFSGRADEQFRWLTRIYKNKEIAKPHIKGFTSNTEPESIIKACEWIEENK